MQRLNRSIQAKEFSRLYLLYGEEQYLCRQYKDKLKSALCEDLSTMNIHHYEGKSIPIGEIIDLSETVPFFAPRRVFILEDTTLFAASGEQMAEYVNSLPDTSTFIFVQKEVDKRTKLYKAIKNHGTITEFTIQDAQTLKQWVASILKKDGLQIHEKTLEYFLEKTGSDMSTIRNELEKLICYAVGNNVITTDDIDAVCSVTVTNHIFDMITTLAQKNQKLALSLYEDLLALKEPAMRILFLISRQCSLLLTVKELRAKGYGNKEIAAAIKLPPFVAGKYMTQSGQFTRERLEQAVRACVEAEEAVKTGRIQDRLSIEMLMLSVFT
ncbi:MAG: DNA polymerase III subunit delta [Clostridium sp.]|jgi:DNA polymerase-3 subunit delta|nr:DNA polymerase III subunit delta [Clostridium sp.]